MITALTGFGLTVIAAEPDLPSLVAVIVAVPAAIAVTSPVDETLATLGALVDHATARPARTWPDPSRGSALSCVVCPTTRSLAFGVTTTAATGTDVIVIVATADLPSLDPVMIALPAASAVTSPLALTLATVALLVANVTGRPGSSLPCASSVWAVIWTVWPTSRSRLVGESLTLATGVGLTVTSAIAVLPSAVAAI